MTFLRPLLFALLALASLPAAAVRDLSGQTPGGAYYRIVAPDDWRAGDPLVLYQHGFDFDPPAPNPSLGPLLEVQLAQGYAVAASSFSQRGWALFRALDDNAELLEVFTRALGAPGEIVAFGGSMGGLVSLKLAEDPRFADRTSSVFAICPAAAGTEAWDFAFDLRLIYDELCEGVSGGELQRGDPPHTWAVNLDQIPPNLDNLENSEDALRALTRVAQCTGLGLPSGFRTVQQRQRLAELQRITRITDEAFLATNLAYAVFAMSDVVRAPDKLGGRSPFDSARPPYASGENVAGLQVVHADPFGRYDLADASSLAGTGSAKILSMHTSKDQLVVPAHQAYLRRRYPAERLVSAIVAEETPTHCAFTVAEGLAGWQALRAWRAGGPKPTVGSLQSACTAIVSTGAAGPCRIDANATIEGVVAQPRLAYRTPTTYSGVWFDPARSGEGIVVEELDDAIGHWQSGRQRVLVSWFTFGVDSEPLWIVGQGEVLADNAVRVRDAYVGRGRTFGGAGTATLERWGRIDLEFPGRDTAGNASMRIRWNGPPDYGSGTLVYRQTSTLALGEAPGFPVASPPAFSYAQSGTYTLDGRPGDGVILQQSAFRAGGAWRALSQLVWYTFDPEGRPLWLVGAAFDGNRTAFDVYEARGTRFGPAFDARDVQRTAWGRVDLELSGCDLVALRWRATNPRYGDGRVTTTRLSRPPRIGGCTP
jgi:hypothetical protein